MGVGVAKWQVVGVFVCGTEGPRQGWPYDGLDPQQDPD